MAPIMVFVLGFLFLFREISATKNKTISWEGHDWDRGLHNHHKMLWSYGGVTGGKTGYTRVAGRCLITTASRNNRNLISVLLNCPSDWNDTKKLLDHGFNSYKKKVLINENEEILNLNIENSEEQKLNLLAAKNFELLFKKDDKIKLKKEIYYADNIDLPVKKGDIVGLMIIKSGNVEESIHLVAASNLDYKSKFKRFWHKFKNGIKEVSILSKERLQKVMAHAGVASRRKSEEIIKEGRVKVNGKVVTEMGVKVNEKEDIIEVDGELISKEKRVYILLYKPEGYVTTVDDPRGRSTVLDLIDDVKERIYPVGRLDYDTSGLLLLTNDGELTYVLTHPSYEIEKTYEVIADGYISDKKIDKLEKGIRLDDGMTAPAKVELKERNKDHSKFNLIIHEGRNRQVRRMCNKISNPVIKLKRISFHNLDLSGLKKGDYRFLSKKELNKLKKLKN
ncbi:MAG: pseudouridine synthase, partial [Bacillota bacterium]